MSDERKGDGQGAGSSGADAGSQAAGPGDHGAATGKDKTKVTSEVAEKAVGQLNPSSPGDTGTTPGTNAKVG
jgi:hypothetical protein